jgi:isopentenyl phosphate kinase
MRKLCFIKIGGSLITEKSKRECLRRDVIADITQQLAAVFRSRGNDTDFVLGIGGGSFGHYYATKYGLINGNDNKHVVFGICKTHHSVQKLAGIVANELLSLDLPVFVISPASCFSVRDGELSGHFTASLETALALGMMPVVYGDTMLDETRGTTIFSTERIFEELIEQLPNYKKSVILLTDVDGVLDKNDRTIQTFSPRSSTQFFASNSSDVTGSMEQKVAAALRMAEHCEQVIIANGHRKNVIENVLNGDYSHSTVVNN